MTKPLISFFLLMLVWGSTSQFLHLQATVQDNQAYLDALTAEEAELQASLSQIQKTIQYLH